ncbi:MAG: methionyl-tRNA formyltransferase [Cyanobacteria bacterium RUI128]|nr:methionyl-tRNA formyltransferase [Cyanobacteria bacterium RUI128]
MAKEYKITILTNQSSWMNKYDLELKNALERLGHHVKIIHSKKELEKGDIAFFLSCFEIVSEEYLVLNNHNIVVHASDLPKGKGWSPTSWQILEGKNEIPITLFEAVKEMDAGDYYVKDVLKLDGSELIDEWQEKLGQKIVDMCLKYVRNYETILGTKQLGKESIYSRRTPADSELDVDKTIREQFNLLRIVDNDNYPAFFEMHGHKYSLQISKVK